jgi:transcriptional regulator with XRE-family HTH domain
MATKKKKPAKKPTKRSKMAIHLSGMVQALRDQAEMTQQALAKKAGLSIAYVSLIERGEREPSLITIERLAAALNASPGALLGV